MLNQYICLLQHLSNIGIFPGQLILKKTKQIISCDYIKTCFILCQVHERNTDLHLWIHAVPVRENTNWQIFSFLQTKCVT